MSRTKDMVMDLMEADDSFDGEGWLREINAKPQPEPQPTDKPISKGQPAPVTLAFN